MPTNGVDVPPARERAAQEIGSVLRPDRRVVLTTHVNADGDGVGSEIGLWYLLKARGVTATIANPTGIPERFDFLIPDGAEASATAELVFDLASALGWPLNPESARALYVGILTDTGGFRFSNTSARALRVAAALLERGVDPEGIYESVYASAPEGRVRLTAEVLQTLVVEAEVGLAWV